MPDIKNNFFKKSKSMDMEMCWCNYLYLNRFGVIYTETETESTGQIYEMLPYLNGWSG